MKWHESAHRFYIKTLQNDMSQHPDSILNPTKWHESALRFYIKTLQNDMSQYPDSILNSTKWHEPALRFYIKTLQNDMSQHSDSILKRYQWHESALRFYIKMLQNDEWDTPLFMFVPHSVRIGQNSLPFTIKTAHWADKSFTHALGEMLLIMNLKRRYNTQFY